jgi:hypothetical protein
MPKVALEIKATLENCKSVKLTPPYVVTVRQTGGNEERENVEIDPDNEEEVFGSKGIVHFKMKFDKKDKFEATVNVVSQKDYSTTNSWKQIAVFETRGLDIVQFKFNSATVTAKSGAVFEDCDLSDPDGFSEYDEKADCPVSITNLEFRFVSA